MRKVIYTCITGSYDALLQPVAIRRDWDYVCFTDKKEASDCDGIWQIRSIPGDSADAAAASRYPKLLPHELLQEYDVSLYMDPNIRILDDAFYDSVESALDKGTPISLVVHGRRDCIYDEIRACYLAGHCRFRDALSMKRKLKKKGFPSHYGLFENNIILRRHMQEGVISLDKAWWNAYMNGIRRDQLHLVPLMHDMGINPGLLLPDGKNARNCTWLEYRPHSGSFKAAYPRPKLLKRMLNRFL